MNTIVTPPPPPDYTEMLEWLADAESFKLDTLSCLSAIANTIEQIYLCNEKQGGTPFTWVEKDQKFKKKIVSRIAALTLDALRVFDDDSTPYFYGVFGQEELSEDQVISSSSLPHQQPASVILPSGYNLVLEWLVKAETSVEVVFRLNAMVNSLNEVYKWNTEQGGRYLTWDGEKDLLIKSVLVGRIGKVILQALNDFGKSSNFSYKWGTFAKTHLKGDVRETPIASPSVEVSPVPESKLAVSLPPPTVPTLPPSANKPSLPPITQAGNKPQPLELFR